MAAERKLKVFLCHSSGDKPRVRDLYKRLQADGFDPWLDEEDLLPGQKWQQEIPKAVRAADTILVCLSRDSIARDGYVQKEIKYALDAADEKPEETIFIIPLRFEDCPLKLSQNSKNAKKSAIFMAGKGQLLTKFMARYTGGHAT